MASSSRLKPGERGRIKATVDIRGRTGVITKTVSVRSNDPERPVTLLSLRMSIKDQTHIGRYHPTEIFSERCRGCHVDRGKGKRGWNLFRADCFICHNAGASTSLTQMSKKPRGSLERIIREGIENTVMPGWDEKHGGPLDETDIESLLDLLSR
ncbi:MAG: c-type cytochrome [Nitrospiraceae bacterium]|nr:c-type cytochrome [Nitrospiraceae bacterium]